MKALKQLKDLPQKEYIVGSTNSKKKKHTLWQIKLRQNEVLELIAPEQSHDGSYLIFSIESAKQYLQDIFKVQPQMKPSKTTEKLFWWKKLSEQAPELATKVAGTYIVSDSPITTRSELFYLLVTQ